MEKLYAPWRESFIKKEHKKDDSCIFCQKSQEKEDAQNFIVMRHQHCFVMMNLYPYNAGHVMVAPYRHVKDFTDLKPEERLDLVNALDEALTVLTNVCAPEGFNVGINLGKVAGAGVPGHLHIHVVPRWNGDTNFMPIVAQTKHISLDLPKLYQQLTAAYTRLHR